MGVDDCGNDKNVPGHGLVEHRNIRLRGDATDFHRYGERFKEICKQAQRFGHAAARMPIFE